MKFDSVNEIISAQGEIPAGVRELLSKEKVSIEMEIDYDCLRDILLLS